MNWKHSTWFLLLASALVSLVPIGVAAYWIFGNTVTVTPRDHNLHLTVSDSNPLRYDNVTFTATLTVGGNPVNGATIYLDRGNVEISSNVTNLGGQAFFTVNITEIAAYTPRYLVGA